MNKFYVTTPIYYVNSHPHLGHLYTTLVADTVARYKRQRGFETFFLTGTDEHGLNIERAAEKGGLPVKRHVDNIVKEFKTAFAPYGLAYDHWIRTTDDYHKRAAQELWRRVRENGYIYKGKYEGLYCANCNEFYTENEAKAGDDGQLCCPQHDRPLDRVAEEIEEDGSHRLRRIGSGRELAGATSDGQAAGDAGMRFVPADARTDDDLPRTAAREGVRRRRHPGLGQRPG